MTPTIADPAKCPKCRHVIEDHWSLIMSDDERKTWELTKSAGVCSRSRGEVLLMINGVR